MKKVQDVSMLGGVSLLSCIPLVVVEQRSIPSRVFFPDATLMESGA